MGDVSVFYGDSAQDTATLLLAAADEAGEDASVVRTVTGGFIVPEDIAKKAGVDYEKPENSADDEPEPEPEKPKKRATKKSAAKKSSK